MRRTKQVAVGALRDRSRCWRLVRRRGVRRSQEGEPCRVGGGSLHGGRRISLR